MRAQLAAAMTQVAHEYVDIPLLVVGGFNAAPPSDDRGMDTLPYDKGNAALTNVLTRLSLTDIHRHKFPPSTHYTWSNSSGRKSRIGAVYANTKALEMAGGVNDFFSSIGNKNGAAGDRSLTGVCSLPLSSGHPLRWISPDSFPPTTGRADSMKAG